MQHGSLAAVSLVLLLAASCKTPESGPRPFATGPDQQKAQALVGTWRSTGEPTVRVTYAEDGTWRSVMSFVIDGDKHQFHGRGTWRVKDGVLHNTTLKHDPIPGMEPIELPYLSKERLVSVESTEYRYVCPVQGCTNTMRRLQD